MMRYIAYAGGEMVDGDAEIAGVGTGLTEKYHWRGKRHEPHLRRRLLGLQRVNGDEFGWGQ